MAVWSNGILGFEIGICPTSGKYPFQPVNPPVTADINATAARSGSYGYQSKITSASVNNGIDIQTDIPVGTLIPGATSWQIRFRYHFQIKVFPSVAGLIVGRIYHGNSQVPTQNLIMNTTGGVAMSGSNIGTGVPTGYSSDLLLNTWYRAEHSVYGSLVGPTTGSDISIVDENGDEVVSLASVQDGSTTIIWPDFISVGQTADGPSCTREIYYDDIWWSFATQVTVESPHGTRIYPFVPTAQGSSNGFTPAGAYTDVNEIPEGGAFVSSTTPGTTTTYTHAALADPTHVVYHIRNYAFWYDDTQAQALMIDGVEYAANAREGIGTARYGLADIEYANLTPLSAASFATLQFGARKKNGGTTLFLAQNFLEVLEGPPVNVAPVVDAGPNQTVLQLDVVQFAGIVTDIDPTTKLWTFISGPVVINPLTEFSDATIVNPTWATTSVPGAYVFRLTADDGSLTGHDDVQITVASDETITFATGTLGFSLTNQGVEINVPTPWQLERFDIGPRREETA